MTDTLDMRNAKPTVKLSNAAEPIRVIAPKAPEERLGGVDAPWSRTITTRITVDSKWFG
jgi:hypothetical protein